VTVYYLVNSKLILIAVTALADAGDEAVPLRPFHHNPLHDIESIWWIHLYFATVSVPKELAESNYAALIKLHSKGFLEDQSTRENLFYGTTPGIRRFGVNYILSDYVRILRAVFTDLAQELHMCYRLVEENLPAPAEAFDGVHSTLANIFVDRLQILLAAGSDCTVSTLTAGNCTENT
jgi:hypothetical protein